MSAAKGGGAMTRLDEAADFLREELTTVHDLAAVLGKKFSPADDSFVRRVVGVGPGPLSVHLISGTCYRGSGSVRWITPRPLLPAETAALANAIAAILWHGGFGDVRVAVFDEHYEGVTFRFTSDKDVEAAKIHASPAGLQ